MSILSAAKAKVFRTAWSLGYEIRRRSAEPELHYLEQDSNYADTIRAVRDFTMTSPEKIAALVDAARYIVQRKIPGAIVECGVWRGGSMMAAALTLLAAGDVRDLYLFDTFAGMTAPTPQDINHMDVPAEGQYRSSMAEDHNEWCYASLADVQRNLLSTGYPQERCHFIKGDVLSTLPHDGLGAIALLRLDTDWYESTRHELEMLYPKLSNKGILILDDYGFWQGARKAVDEYFRESGPFLAAIGILGMGKLAVKTSDPT